MSLGVIGAGLPRTGTLSMKAALEELGLGACYHMEEVFKAPWRAKHWERVFRGEPIEWDEVFEGYGATVDAPGCIVWRDLVARYPQAKVILTLRDRDAWCESMYKTVLSERHQAAIATSAVAPMFEAMAPRFMQIAGWPSPCMPRSMSTRLSPDRARVKARTSSRQNTWREANHRTSSSQVRYRATRGQRSPALSASLVIKLSCNPPAPFIRQGICAHLSPSP